MEIWGKDHLNDVAVSTAHEYRQKVKTYIVPVLGQIKLQKLTFLMVQSFVNSLTAPKESGGRGLSHKYARDIFGVLHKSLEKAVDAKLIPSNPSNNCSLPRLDDIPHEHYEEAQLIAFITAIQSHIHENYYLTLLLTGMREAEPLGLTWKNVDFDRGVIHVRQQLQRNRDTGVYELVTPKRQEFRTLPMGSELCNILKAQRQEVQRRKEICGSSWIDKDLVFPNPVGDFLSYRTVYDCYKRIVAKLGFPDLRVHDLRHAYTTLALGNGDDIKTVQTLLGHKTPEFTLKVYAHSTDAAKQKSGERMDEALRQLRGQ